VARKNSLLDFDLMGRTREKSPLGR
jgi:hypothetical protein